MVQFNGQRSSETVRLTTHQHPFVLFPHFLIAVVLLLVAVAGFTFLSGGIALSIILGLAPILAIFKILESLYLWRNTLLLVTNERVGFFHQKKLFKREFYECPLQMVVQVSHKVEGVGQTVFGFGTVIVNTGDAESSILIKDVPDPFEIQQEIQNALVV
jgi:hypothetical protein